MRERQTGGDETTDRGWGRIKLVLKFSRLYWCVCGFSSYFVCMCECLIGIRDIPRQHWGLLIMHVLSLRSRCRVRLLYWLASASMFLYLWAQMAVCEIVHCRVTTRVACIKCGSFRDTNKKKHVCCWNNVPVEPRNTLSTVFIGIIYSVESGSKQKWWLRGPWIILRDRHIVSAVLN